MRKQLLTFILSFISLISFGQIGYEFNGANNSKILSPDIKTELSNLNTLTVEFWAKMATLDNQSFANIVLPGIANAGGFSLIANKMTVSLQSDYGNYTQSNDISSLISVNSWHHFAYVFSSGTWNFYLDGVNVGTSPNEELTTQTLDYASYGSAYFEFGKVSTALSNYEIAFSSLTGAMDDIRIWNTARTVTQIANNKDTELTGSETGLILYYKLNETSGQLVLDSSPNNLDGTLGSTSAVESSDATINKTGIVTSSVLPVKLVNFDLSQKTTGEIYLTWRTASEKNNERFEVLKSGDGKNFELLSSVNANSGFNYNVIDSYPFIGISYYQLVQYDFNGNKTILATESFKSALSSPKLAIYPNPTADLVIINLNGQQFTQATLTDVQGNVLETKLIDKEMTLIKFDLSRFPSAVYFVRLVGDKNSTTSKILKK